MNIFNKIFKVKEQKFTKDSNHAYFCNYHAPHWSERDYQQFADQAYIKNVVAHRAINIIAQSAASVPWSLHKNDKFQKKMNQLPQKKTHLQMKVKLAD